MTSYLTYIVLNQLIRDPTQDQSDKLNKTFQKPVPDTSMSLVLNVSHYYNATKEEGFLVNYFMDRIPQTRTTDILIN